MTTKLRLVKLERRLPPTRQETPVDLSRLTRDQAHELCELVRLGESGPGGRWRYDALTDAEFERLDALAAKLEGREA